MARRFADVVRGLPPGRSWLRFSLKAVFLFVTAFCVVCGWLGAQVERVHRQRRAVDEIEASGGELEFVGRDQSGPETLLPRITRRWLHTDYFDEVCGVWFTKARTTDADFARLQLLPNLPRLQNLVVVGTAMTGDGFGGVPGLEGLTFLVLERNRLTDRGLAPLEKMEALADLTLGEKRVTDAGIAHLRNLTKLERLRLGGTKVTDVGLRHLSRLTSLELLGLQFTPVTDAGLVQVGGLLRLEFLYLEGTRVTDEGLKHLHGLTALKEIRLRGTGVTKSGVAKLQKTLPRCRVLWP